MRKTFLTLTAMAFIISLALLISGVAGKMSKQDELNEKITYLPAFSFITLEKHEFNSWEIKEGPVLIIRFHPECDHCQYEISQILKSDIPYIVSKTLFISNADPDSIRNFLKQFEYSDFQSIIVLSDTSDSFTDIFGRNIVPSNYIYDKDLKLVKVLMGEVKTETIRKYLLQSE